MRIFALVALLLVLASMWLLAPAMAQGEDWGVDDKLAEGPATLFNLRLVDRESNAPARSFTSLPVRVPLDPPRRLRLFRLSADFELPLSAATPPWAVHVTTMHYGGRVNVNGSFVGEVRTADLQHAVLNIRPQLFTIPQQLLVDGLNKIEIEWSTHDALMHVPRIEVGAHERLEPDYRRRLFWQNSLAQIGFDFALVNATLLLGIYALRRQETRYLLMGVTALGWACVCVNFFLPPLPAWFYPYWYLIRIMSIALVAGCAFVFLARETRMAHPRYAWICLAWGLVGPLGFLVNHWGREAMFEPLFEATWSGVLMALGTYPLWLMLRALKQRWDWRLAVFGGVTLLAISMGAVDTVIMLTGRAVFKGLGFTTQATSSLWFAAVAAVLIKDFADSVARQRDQQRHMARELNTQRMQLQSLHEAMQLRERERAAQSERQRIMQDMHDGLGSQLVSSLALAERGQLSADQTSAVLRECIDDLRLAIDSLARDEESFVVMAGNLRFRMEPRLQAAGIKLRWDAAHYDDEVPLNPSARLPLLRMLQESLSNALRHAAATADHSQAQQRR